MKISIIIPAYNVSEYITRCLDSVINQTYKNIEIIIVNDGSTDDTDQKIQPYLSDKRVKYIKQPNAGALKARGNGIKKATGSYCMFVDADDWIDISAVDKLHKCIINEAPDIIKFNATVEPQHKPYQKYHIANGRSYTAISHDAAITALYCSTIFHELALNIYKTELIKNHISSFNANMSFGEDLYVNLDIIPSSQKIILMEDRLYHYFKDNSHSTTSTTNLRKAEANINDAIKLNRKLYLLVKNANLEKNSYADAVLHILRNYMWSLYGVGAATYAQNGTIDIEHAFSSISSLEQLKDIRKTLKKSELCFAIARGGPKSLLLHSRLINAIYDNDIASAKSSIMRHSRKVLEKNIFKKYFINEDLYILSFYIFVVSRMLEASTISNLGHTFYQIATILASVILFVKFVLQRHSVKNIVTSSLILSILTILTLLGAPYFILITFLSFIAIKDVSIRRVLRGDIGIKAFFLLSHLLVLLYGIIFDDSLLQQTLSVAPKGISCSLFFANPNTAGLIGIWLVIDFLYLKGDNKKMKDFIAPTILVLAMFLLTRSRTSLLIYAIYAILQLVKNNSVLFIIQKAIYPVLLLMSFVMVSLVEPGGSTFGSINAIFSGRFSHSIIAYRAAGMHLLPNKLPSEFYTSQQSVLRLTVDNFFVRGFIQYGLLELAIYYLQYALLPKNSSLDVKRISIAMNLYLFFELTIAFAGFCTPNLIIANSIINRKEQ